MSPLRAFALLFTLSTACGVAAPPPPVELVGEERFAFADPAAAPRVDLPYFDSSGRLRWNDSPIHQQATGACDTVAPQRLAAGQALYPRQTRMLGPRVDERRCPRPGGAGTEAVLMGLDPGGQVSWQRPLVFRSGKRQIDQWLIGATPDGLVLSSLEVWSPLTGETVVPAPTHPVEPEGRPVPDHELTGTAIYHPGRREILAFTADVTLTRRRGGLYRIDQASGERELLHPVTATLAGSYERVEAMALDPAGRLLLLARRSSVRGASSVSFAVFDLDSRRYLFQERHGTGHTCSEPRTLVGPNGQVVFSYRDANDRQFVVVRYRLTR